MRASPQIKGGAGMRIKSIKILRRGTSIKIDAISFSYILVQPNVHPRIGHGSALGLSFEKHSSSDFDLKTYISCEISAADPPIERSAALEIENYCQRALRSTFRVGVLQLDDALWSIELRGKDQLKRLQRALDAFELRFKSYLS